MSEDSVFKPSEDGYRKCLLTKLEDELVLFTELEDELIGKSISSIDDEAYSNISPGDMLICKVWWFDGTEEVNIEEYYDEELFTVIDPVSVFEGKEGIAEDLVRLHNENKTYFAMLVLSAIEKGFNQLEDGDNNDSSHIDPDK